LRTVQTAARDPSAAARGPHGHHRYCDRLGKLRVGRHFSDRGVGDDTVFA
jgi:hypothetical protein